MQRPLPAEHRTQISEEWLLEWFEYGLRELAAYLTHQAAFDKWLVQHNRKGEES